MALILLLSTPYNDSPAMQTSDLTTEEVSIAVSLLEILVADLDEEDT